MCIVNTQGVDGYKGWLLVAWYKVNGRWYVCVKLEGNQDIKRVYITFAKEFGSHLYDMLRKRKTNITAIGLVVIRPKMKQGKRKCVGL